jgi:putative redox protein
MQIGEGAIASATAQIGHTKYQTIVSSGGHNVIVDEPETIEGGDTGMEPHGLLLGSLGSCTAITLRMYINRKMWPVDEITVDLELFKTETGVTIKRWLNFKGELSDIQRNRLLQIADACPIHKILTGSIHIETGFGTPAV